VYVNGVSVTSTYVSPAEVRVQLPAKTVGTYSLMLFTSTGLGAIYANGIVYSLAPSWAINTYNNPTLGNTVNVQLLATGDSPLTYSLQSGSVLPTGVTLSSSGLLSGTAIGIGNTTTVNFNVVAMDLEGQTSSPLISLSLTFYFAILWIWGRNQVGQLGLGNTTDYSSPMQVGSPSTWKVIKSGSASAFVTAESGALWVWGSNSVGLLGLGNNIAQSSPVQVGTLTNWGPIAIGSTHVATVKTDGTLWTWGSNSAGQLGLATPTTYSSPKQVGALTNWRSVGNGSNHNIAVKTDNTLWAWGRNLGHGNLGLGDTLNRSSPVQVGTLTNWLMSAASNYASAAVKTDGTLWTWGQGVAGALGQGDTQSRSSPVQVGSLTTWVNVVVGSACMFAFMADGTLWSWGDNTYGKLGHNTSIDRSSPVQVGTLYTWLSVSTDTNSTIAVRQDKTLWGWGNNTYGQLGQGSTVTNQQSPVQIGSLTTWKSVTSGLNWSAGISD